MRGAGAIVPDLPLDAADPGAASGNARAPLLPRLTPSRDHVLPILIALSFAVHATVILPSLLRDGARPPPPVPKEVPVEVVQLPPKPAEKPKPQAKPAPPAQPKTEPSAKQQQIKPAQETKAKAAPKPPPARAAAHRQGPRPRAQRAQPRASDAKPQQDRQSSKDQPQQADGAERMRQLLGPIPPGMDAIALPGTSAEGSIQASYAQLVLSQVAKAKKEGKFHGTPGAASVSFVVGDNGELTSVQIVRPSGDASLDEEAVAMVRRAAPFPVPPPGGRRDYTVTLRFKLTS